MTARTIKLLLTISYEVDGEEDIGIADHILDAVAANVPGVIPVGDEDTIFINSTEIEVAG